MKTVQNGANPYRARPQAGAAIRAPHRVASFLHYRFSSYRSAHRSGLLQSMPER